jgi:hypothetical protein
MGPGTANPNFSARARGSRVPHLAGLPVVALCARSASHKLSGLGLSWWLGLGLG